MKRRGFLSGLAGLIGLALVPRKLRAASVDDYVFVDGGCIEGIEAISPLTLVTHEAILKQHYNSDAIEALSMRTIKFPWEQP